MCGDVRRYANFRICGIISVYAILKTQLYVEKYAICGFCNICDQKQESLANANVKRATAVHVWRPLSKKSKLSREWHARSKRHCDYLVCIRNYVILVWYMKFACF